MLVTCLINFVIIVLLRTVESKERVRILLATLHDTTQSVAKGFTKIRYWADQLRKVIRIYILQSKN